MGPLLQNPEIVMQARFRNAAGAPLAPTSPPLLRGSLLNDYHRGEWKLSGVGTRSRDRLATAPDDPGLVRELITIEPLSDPVLFGVYPPYRSGSVRSNRHVRYDPDRQRLVRTNGEVQSQEFSYEILTTGLVNGRQVRLVPLLDPREVAMPDLLQLPDKRPRGTAASPAPPIDRRDALTGLRAFAARTIRAANIPAGDAYAEARALERALSRPPFEYTLDRPPATAGIDPIEDFVTHNPRGHCEYFATRPDADAPQPGDSGPDGDRLSRRRLESQRLLLRRAAASCPCLGRGLSRSATSAQSRRGRKCRPTCRSARGPG